MYVNSAMGFTGIRVGIRWSLGLYQTYKIMLIFLFFIAFWCIANKYHEGKKEQKLQGVLKNRTPTAVYRCALVIK